MSLSSNALCAKAKAMYGGRLNKNVYLDLTRKQTIGEVVSYLKSQTSYADALKDINITSPIGAIVPLREIAEFESGKRSNMITKENLENTIDIYGYIDSRAYSHVTSEIQKLIDK